MSYSKSFSKKSLFQMNVFEIQKLIALFDDRCLICNKKITPKVSKSRFCLVCSIKEAKPIRILLNRSKLMRKVLEVY